MNKNLFPDTLRHSPEPILILSSMGFCDEETNVNTVADGSTGRFLEILLILAWTQMTWILLKMTPQANMLLLEAAQVHTLQQSSKFTQLGVLLKHHIMNIEINTKWLNNSSGDRACWIDHFKCFTISIIMRVEYKVLCVWLMILEWQVCNSTPPLLEIVGDPHAHWEKPLQAQGEAGVFAALHRWLGALLMRE